MPFDVKPGWVVEHGPPDPPYFRVVKLVAIVLAGLIAASMLGLVFLLLVVGW